MEKLTMIIGDLMRTLLYIENQDFIAIALKWVTAQGNKTTYIDHVAISQK